MSTLRIGRRVLRWLAAGAIAYFLDPVSGSDRRRRAGDALRRLTFGTSVTSPSPTPTRRSARRNTGTVDTGTTESRGALEAELAHAGAPSELLG